MTCNRCFPDLGITNYNSSSKVAAWRFRSLTGEQLLPYRMILSDSGSFPLVSQGRSFTDRPTAMSKAGYSYRYSAIRTVARGMLGLHGGESNDVKLNKKTQSSRTRFLFVLQC